MADRIEELKASIKAYIDKVDLEFADVKQKIADAITADDAAEDSALAGLKDIVDEAKARLDPVTPSTNP